MKGKTFIKVSKANDNEELVFIEENGCVWRFYHEQDCSETVEIESIVGELQDLENHPLLMAEEVSSDDEPAPINAESYTWTFYKFATIKGYVDVRWLGKSNGYYSERVHLQHREPTPEEKQIIEITKSHKKLDENLVHKTRDKKSLKI